MRAGEILSPNRLERGDAGSSALRDMQGRSANLSMQGDPGQSTRAPSPRSRPCRDGHLRTRVADACQARFDVSATAPTHGLSRRQCGVGNGMPGQCGRGMRRADSHGERDDDRAEGHRCRPHDRHNVGRNPQPPVADAAPNKRDETVRMNAAELPRVCAPIDHNGSDRSPSRLVLMPLGAGICERCARDRSPPGPRRRKAARLARARRAGSPARAPFLICGSRGSAVASANSRCGASGLSLLSQASCHP